MTVEANLTTKLAKAQSIDMVNIFGNSIQKLLKMLKLEDKIVMPVGSTIKTYTSKVTLDGTKVDPGDVIPLSKVESEPGPTIELEWDKKRKAVAAEDIQKYGFEQAISETDTKLLRELQKEIKKKFFAQLNKGTTEVSAKGLQGALAMAWGTIQEKFEDDDVVTIAFVNPLDIAEYLSKANISIQSAFGLKYVEDFLGADVVVISTGVEKGKLFATASGNLKLAYANMSGGEVSKAFDFITDETGLIGVSHDINKTRLTAETITASAMILFAERLDGIAKVTILPELGA